MIFAGCIFAYSNNTPGGRPARERTGPLPYRVRKMIMALIIRSRIANIFSARARCVSGISFLRGYAGGVIPAGIFIMTPGYE
jgi:hypothetical protein